MCFPLFKYSVLHLMAWKCPRHSEWIVGCPLTTWWATLCSCGASCPGACVALTHRCKSLSNCLFIPWVRAEKVQNDDLPKKQFLPSTNNRTVIVILLVRTSHWRISSVANPSLVRSLNIKSSWKAQVGMGGAAGFTPTGALFFSFLLCVLKAMCAHGWDRCARVGGGRLGQSPSYILSAVWKPVCNVTKEILMEGRGKRKENERFWVKALDLLSSLNTPLGVSANVKVTSGCRQTA